MNHVKGNIAPQGSTGCWSWTLVDDNGEVKQEGMDEICSLVNDMRNRPGIISDGYHTFNELYNHRAALFCALSKAMPDKAWKTKQHEDGSMFDGMFLAGINLPTGTITYHMDLVWYNVFQGEELERAPHWDGHTPSDVVNRLSSFALGQPKSKETR